MEHFDELQLDEAPINSNACSSDRKTFVGMVLLQPHYSEGVACHIEVLLCFGLFVQITARCVSAKGTLSLLQR